MLPIITDLRPRRSTSQPPRRPKTPPHRAVIQSTRPTHAVTSGWLGGTRSTSDSAGARTSGVMSSSYVSKRKPMAATISTSHAVKPRRAAAGEELTSASSGEWGTSSSGLLDHALAHRGEQREQLVLLGRADLVLVQRPHQRADQRVEVGVGDSLALVCVLHVTAGVLLRPPSRLADLLDQLLL